MKGLAGIVFAVSACVFLVGMVKEKPLPIILGATGAFSSIWIYNL